MAQLIYSAIASLDGYVEDQNREFRLGHPRRRGVQLSSPSWNGRSGHTSTGAECTRRCSTGKPPIWPQTSLLLPATSPRFGKRRTRSSTPGPSSSVSSAKTRIERNFDANAVRHLKATSDQDMTVGGPNLAAQALRAGLVDELQLFVVPIVVGGGKHWLPDGARIALELIDVRRFASGVVYLRYCPAS